MFHVSVTHWQTLEEVKVEVADSMTLNEFKRNIKLAFNNDSFDSDFRIYRLPKDFKLIEERKKIDNDEDLCNLLKEFNNPKIRFPLIYAWDDEHSSPTQLPRKFSTEPLETLSQSTDVSTEYKFSLLTRQRDEYICLLCGSS